MRVVPKPWGREEIFAENERYAGKLLHISPGHSLSLQYHERKDETLYVLEGEVVLLVGTAEKMQEMRLSRGEAFRITPGNAAPHARREALRARGSLLARARRRRPARRRLWARGNDSAVTRPGGGGGSRVERRAGVALWLLAGTALAAVTPTPTPRPRLSGGFGRPRSTPVAPTLTDGGQSLSDVVRAAQEGRDGAAASPSEKSGITIDNRSLVKNPDKGKVSTSALLPTRTPVAASQPASPEPSADASGAPPTGGEAEWQEIARRDRKAVADARARVAELSATASKLENDFYAWDDGQYRDRVIKPAWDRTLSDLDAAKRQLAEAEKNLADLPERARKAGALPGWIRE